MLTLTINYATAEPGLPSPVRRSVLRLPAGLSLDIPDPHSCTAARLRTHGPEACPAQAEIGHGYARVESSAGSQIITENLALWAFLGPPRDLQPTFEILAQGFTPFAERMVFGGTVRMDRAPYGEELRMSIPPIPTLPFEPDATVVTFSLTIGATRRATGRGSGSRLSPSRSHGSLTAGSRTSNSQSHGSRKSRPRDLPTVVAPTSCPPGGFPFAAEFAYADGSTGSSLATAPCPPTLKSRPAPLPLA